MGVIRKVVQGLEFAEALAGRAEWDGGGFDPEWAAIERGLGAVWVAFGPIEAPLRHGSGMKWEEAAPRQHSLARLRPLWISLLPLFYRMEHNYYANYFQLILADNMRFMFDLPDSSWIEGLDKIGRIGQCGYPIHRKVRDEWGIRNPHLRIEMWGTRPLPAGDESDGIDMPLSCLALRTD